MFVSMWFANQIEKRHDHSWHIRLHKDEQSLSSPQDVSLDVYLLSAMSLYYRAALLILLCWFLHKRFCRDRLYCCNILNTAPFFSGNVTKNGQTFIQLVGSVKLPLHSGHIAHFMISLCLKNYRKCTNESNVMCVMFYHQLLCKKWKCYVSLLHQEAKSVWHETVNSTVMQFWHLVENSIITCED